MLHTEYILSDARLPLGFKIKNLNKTFKKVTYQHFKTNLPNSYNLRFLIKYTNNFAYH